MTLWVDIAAGALLVALLIGLIRSRSRIRGLEEQVKDLEFITYQLGRAAGIIDAKVENIGRRRKSSRSLRRRRLKSKGKR